MNGKTPETSEIPLDFVPYAVELLVMRSPDEALRHYVYVYANAGRLVIELHSANPPTQTSQLGLYGQHWIITKARGDVAFTEFVVTKPGGWITRYVVLTRVAQKLCADISIFEVQQQNLPKAVSPALNTNQHFISQALLRRFTTSGRLQKYVIKHGWSKRGSAPSNMFSEDGYNQLLAFGKFNNELDERLKPLEDTLPDTLAAFVAIIGNQAFYGCSSLTNLTIGNSVTSIGDQAFYGCSGLTSLKMGNRVAQIGDSAFEACSHLKNLTHLDNVLNIGDAAFRFCNGLTNVMFGPSLTNLGDEAFRYCTSLHQVYFQGNAPSVDGLPGSGNSTLFSGESGTAYYMPGRLGWGANFGGFSTAFWYQPRPQILGSDYGLGARTNGFQFTISWATNTAVIVEASTNLQNWMPVITNALVKGTNSFGDSTWTNYPQRFYRVRSQ